MYYLISRREYLDKLARFNIKPVTGDNNRCILMTAGYLGRVTPGVYKLLKKIPHTLTYTQARKEAYG